MLEKLSGNIFIEKVLFYLHSNEKAYDSLPEDLRTKFYEALVRKRPRRQGKPQKVKRPFSAALSAYSSTSTKPLPLPSQPHE